MVGPRLLGAAKGDPEPRFKGSFGQAGDGMRRVQPGIDQRLGVGGIRREAKDALDAEQLRLRLLDVSDATQCARIVRQEMRQIGVTQVEFGGVGQYARHVAVERLGGVPPRRHHERAGVLDAGQPEDAGGEPRCPGVIGLRLIGGIDRSQRFSGPTNGARQLVL
jgi:hypothetical protein